MSIDLTCQVTESFENHSKMRIPIYWTHCHSNPQKWFRTQLDAGKTIYPRYPHEMDYTFMLVSSRANVCKKTT